MCLGHPADKVPFAKIYGVLPFVAPEVICGGRYTMASDIYSFGIIMWMLGSMQLPFADRAHGLELAKDITNGIRPTIDIFMPDLFLSLMNFAGAKSLPTFQIIQYSTPIILKL
jgi:serine/threonine protein kinase